MILLTLLKSPTCFLLSVFLSCKTAPSFSVIWNHLAERYACFCNAILHKMNDSMIGGASIVSFVVTLNDLITAYLRTFLERCYDTSHASIFLKGIIACYGRSAEDAIFWLCVVFRSLVSRFTVRCSNPGMI